MSAAELYERDFAEWALQNAQLLRSGRTADADLEHIAEEIEDLARRYRQAVRRRLMRLIQHLLKWQTQPGRRSRSWQATINEQRFRIRESLDINPSFRRELGTWIAQVYDYAVRQAAVETGADVAAFPVVCPYTVEQVLDLDFLPV